MAAEDYFVHRHQDSFIAEDHLDVWRPIPQEIGTLRSRSTRRTGLRRQSTTGPKTRQPWPARSSKQWAWTPGPSSSASCRT
jgi:hypothetical protein